MKNKLTYYEKWAYVFLVLTVIVWASVITLVIKTTI